jgi:8-oxo-dGTP diphosphatase
VLQARATRMPSILVTAGVIVENGKVLLAQRKPGDHQALAWEFPGGKVEDGEDPRDALARELGEELGVRAVVGDVIDVTLHRYPDRAVLLIVFAASVAPGSGPPRPVDAADLRWVSGRELDQIDLCDADRALVTKVRRLLA